MRTIYSLGMRKVEEAFSEAMSRMHMDFEEKAYKFERTQWQLEANLRYLEQYYVKMQEKSTDDFIAALIIIYIVPFVLIFAVFILLHIGKSCVIRKKTKFFMTES